MKGPGILLACAMLVNGCAVGNKYDYRVADMALPVKGQSSVGLMIADKRPYVLSGNKDPSFVGLQRGGFGNPFDVTTMTGAPLASDIAEAVAAGLRERGYTVRVIGYVSGDAGDMLVSAAKKDGLSKTIAVTIREWKTDIYMKMTLHYDLEAVVYGADGSILGRNRMAAIEEVGGSGIGAEKNAHTARQALSQKISYLFYHPDIKKALDG